MIDFVKDLYSYSGIIAKQLLFKEKHVFLPTKTNLTLQKNPKLDINELKRLQLKLLELESSFFVIETNKNYNKRKLNQIKTRIDELKIILETLIKKNKK